LISDGLVVMNKNKITYLFPFSIVFFEIATYLANDMYLPGLPALMKDFQISQGVAQDTLLYWFLGSASMQLLIGPLSDRFGRRIVLLLGAVGYIFASFSCAITQDIFVFLVARFVQGCTVCAVVVAGYSAIHEHYAARIAIRIVAIMGSIVILAPAFGPILGAMVIAFAHWRLIFYILGGWGALSFILLVKAVPDTQTEKHALDLKVILRDYMKIATRKDFLVFTLPFCFMFLSLISWVVESPFLIIQRYQKSTMDYGLIQLAVFGCFMIGAQITGRLVQNWSPLRLIKMGIILGLLGAGLLVTFSILEYPLFSIVLSMMLCALGFAMTFGPLSRLAIESCQEPMGRRMAIFSSFMSFFGVFATMLIGAFENNSMHNLSIIISAGAILAFVFFFFLKKPDINLDNSPENIHVG